MTTVTPPVAISSPPGDDLGEKIAAVSKVLNVLQALPAEDPPADLVSRTLQRVREAGATHVAPLTLSERPVV